jgi:hypothetical protein
MGLQEELELARTELAQAESRRAPA